MRFNPSPGFIRLSIWLSIALLASVTSACGGSTTPTETPANAPTAVPASVDANCPFTLVDTWLKYSAANTKGFIDLMNASISIQSNQALAVATQLGQFEGRVLATQAPPCAATEKQAIQLMMDNVLQAFKAYAQVPALTLKNSSALALANAQYVQIQKMQQDLMNKFPSDHP